MARRRPELWAAHPFLAWCVRVGVLLVPVLASVLAGLAVMALLPRPEGTWGHVGWWAAVLSAALAASWGVDRYARRALPLAVLLQLSLVFPDRAPSRLRTARRTGLREIERQVEALHDQDDPGEAARALVALVGALGQHDKRTRGHSERVRLYVDMLTEQLGLTEEDRVRLRWASLLHDIGKLTVPGSVLNGGRDIRAEEWDSLRSHPEEGHRLAVGLLPWLGEWGRCVREHHERWDGSGYPLGLKGTEISLGARIVSVADAYEVMTANRSYSKAMTPEAARKELAACAGTHFDPAVVRAFLEISLGKLRGILGPVAFLSVVPLALGDRFGKAVQTSTGMVAAASVAALALPAADARPQPTPVPASPPQVVQTAPRAAPPALVTPSPDAVALPTPVAGPTPAPSRTPDATPSPRATPSSAEPSPPAVPPAAFGRLYLATGLGLRRAAPTESTGAMVTVRSRPVAFTREVRLLGLVDGAPTVTVFEKVVTRRGKGTPKGTLTVRLLDCLGETCRTLSTGTTTVGRQPRGWQQRTVTMSPVTALVLIGHELRLVFTLQPKRNIDSVLLGFDGLSTPSRLEIP